MSRKSPSPNHILICCIHLDSACLNKNHVIEVGVRFFVHKVEKRAKFVVLAFLEYQGLSSFPPFSRTNIYLKHTQFRFVKQDYSMMTMAMMMMMIARDDVLSELFFINIITLSMIIRKPNTIQNISKFKASFAFCKVASSNLPVSRQFRDKKGCLLQYRYTS